MQSGFSDPEMDSLVAVIVQGPGRGTLTMLADGSFVYTPNAGFTGSDYFTYQVSDGQLNSAVSVVAIEVTLPPAINGGGNSDNNSSSGSNDNNSSSNTNNKSANSNSGNAASTSMDSVSTASTSPVPTSNEPTKADTNRVADERQSAIQETIFGGGCGKSCAGSLSSTDELMPASAAVGSFFWNPITISAYSGHTIRSFRLSVGLTALTVLPCFRSRTAS